jgi:serine protease Do
MVPSDPNDPTGIPVRPTVVPPTPMYVAPPQTPSRTPLLLMILLLLLAGLILPSVAERIQYAVTRGDQAAKAEVARDALKGLPAEANRYVLAAKAIAPSVVGIKTVQLVRRRTVGDDWTGGFGATQGEGSGVIVGSDGFVVTNFHVVNGASQLAVQLADGRTIRNVRIVGADPATDLAVLKIGISGLVAAPWGDSDKLQVGEPVLAVGNPYGLARTVTAGIISALDRREATELGYQEFLQTDAAVNPGNSGGPLVNLQGEVVGINAAIVGPAYRGISFAIPSRLAQEVYNRLKSDGKMSRGWLGVAMEELTAREARRLGLNDTSGVLVAAVVPDSPAAAAGLEPQDVIVRWNGRAVTDPFELSRAVARSKAGAVAKVEVIRNGKSQELEVKVAERPTDLERQ